MNKNKLRAWVLAEWLTALALLAVIAMLTLPNYFEAKTRSETSQVLADLRRLETALTSYRLDNGRWIDDAYFWTVYAKPRISCNEMNVPFIWGHLTTPVAYFRSVPVDPFLGVDRAVDDSGAGNVPHTPIPYYWYYGLSGWMQAVAEIHGLTRDQWLGDWLMASPGPDKSWGYGQWSFWMGQRDAGFPRVYDPSNGIVSYGDIVRWENMERTLVAPIE